MPFTILAGEQLRGDKRTLVLATLKANLDATDIHHATMTFLRYYTRQAPFAEHDESWE
jgi:hypothetical protein